MISALMPTWTAGLADLAECPAAAAGPMAAGRRAGHWLFRLPVGAPQ